VVPAGRSKASLVLRMHSSCPTQPVPAGLTASVHGAW
jgi:hypothetical protein